MMAEQTNEGIKSGGFAGFSKPATADTQAAQGGAQGGAPADTPGGPAEPGDSGGQVVEASAPSHFYSSLPIQTYILGDFKFQHGYLSLTTAENAEFQALLQSQPLSEQVKVKTLTSAPGITNSPQLTQGIQNSDSEPAA